MNPFQQNIISIYGERGKIWLNELESRLHELSLKWNLRDLRPLSNLTYHYVCSGFQDLRPIIVKIGMDTKSLRQEAAALECFRGYGAVQKIAEDLGALLLERCISGSSLKDYFPAQERDAIEITSMVIKRCHQATISKNHTFPHIQDWLSTLDREWDIPREYLKKARSLRNWLLKTAGPDVLLHGDLHHDNILEHGQGWLVIDPKGVLGESAYETAAFIRNPSFTLLKKSEALNLIKNRIEIFADLLEVSQTRIKQWFFVQNVLAWAWALEDRCDHDYFEKLTKDYSFFESL